MTDVFEVWRHVPIILAALGQTAFVMLYALRGLGAGEWWKDPIGRALFVKSGTLALLLDTFLLAYISRWLHGEYTELSMHLAKYDGNLEYVVVTGLWLVCFGVYFQLWALVRQRFYYSKRNDDKKS